MIDYVKVLEENKVGVLASVLDGKPKTRVFQYLFTKDDKVYLCTSNLKPIYKQLTENPNVSFCVYNKAFDPVLSVNGPTVFVDDIKLKEEVLEKFADIKNIYQEASNPIFELFYIQVSDIETFSFTEGPKYYTL